MTKQTVDQLLDSLRCSVVDAVAASEDVIPLLREASQKLDEEAVSVASLKSAADRGIFVSKVLVGSGNTPHPASSVANAAASLANVRVLRYREGTKRGLEFVGYAPDVKFVLYAAEAAQAAMDAEWEKFKETELYYSTPRRERGSLRENLMRTVSEPIRSYLAELAARRAIDVSEGNRPLDVVVIKRELISEILGGRRS